MSPNEADYMTQEDIAKELGVPIERIRPTVTALSGIGVIKTMRSIRDRRYVLVHKDSLEKIRQAIYNIGT